MRLVPAARVLRASTTLLLAAALALPAPVLAREPSSDETAEAKQLTKEGLAAFDDERYDDAIEKFERAFELAKVPGLLLNIAQAHRLNGSCRKALDQYLKFLRLAPGSRHEDEVNTRIKEMQGCIDKETARANQGGAPGTTTGGLPPLSPDAPDEEGVTFAGRAAREDAQADARDRERERERPGDEPKLKPLTWGLLGAGVLGLGVGLVYGSRAREAARTVDGYLDMGGPWTADYAKIEEKGQRDENIAFYGIGLAVAAFGTVGVLYYMGEAFEKPTAGSTVTPAPAPGGGASLVWSGAW